MSIARPSADPEVTGWVRRLAAGQDPRVGPTTPVVPLLSYPLPTRPFLPERAGVFLCAGVAVKLHRRGSDAADLARRLAAVVLPDLEPAWVQPLGYRPLPLPDGRLATVWPRVSVLSTLDRPPWEDAARLLARVHLSPLPADPPRTRPPLAGVDPPAGDLARLADGLRAELASAPATTWVHGGFHLGHLAHTPLRRRWKLVDIDNLGLGQPAWDLARPAACHAAGLLDDASWGRFLDAYRSAGGPAVPPSGDPWPGIELPARAAALGWAVGLLGRPDAAATAEALLAVARGATRP